MHFYKGLLSFHMHFCKGLLSFCMHFCKGVLQEKGTEAILQKSFRAGKFKLCPLFSAGRLFLERHSVEGLGRSAGEAGAHGGDALPGDFKGELAAPGGIAGI